MTHYEEISKKSTLKHAWKKLNKKPGSVGLDGVTISDFRVDLDENLQKLSDTLLSKKFTPVNLKPYMLKKPEGDYRVLRIPAVRDRIVQRAILNTISNDLNKLYNIEGNGVSYAYVETGGVKSAAEEIVKLWNQGYDYVYKTDIVKFFDNVNKEELLKKISAALGEDQSLMELIRDFLYCEVENNKQVAAYDPTIYHPMPLLGLAQGSPLSPVFANVYLADFDKAMIGADIKMIRYADDILIMTKTLDEAVAAHTTVKNELTKLGLKVHDLKVRGQLPAKGHSMPKYSEATRCQDVIFLGLTFKSKKIYPAGRSYQNATKSVRYAAYDTGTSFVQKLVSIQARVFGWTAAYSFTNIEPAKLATIDALLDKALLIMLKKQGLSIKKGASPHKALGIDNYTSSYHTILADEEKKKKKALRRQRIKKA